MTAPAFIGVRAAAKILGVHENTIRNWYAQGLLTGVPLRPDGTFLRFARADVEALAPQLEPHETLEPDEGYGVVLEVAKAVVWATSSGCCEYGKVCALCDCFADGDGGAYRDQCARAAGRAALAEWSRTR